MTADEIVRDPAGYDHPRCLVCGGRIRLSDHSADRRVLQPDGSTRIDRGHRACLKEGVERWEREGRPHDSPLTAARREGWRWAADPPVRLDG